jgi:hypothetical protein
MGVFDEVTVSMLIAVGALSVYVLFVVSQVWIIAHRIEVTCIVLTLERSTARDARLASVAQSDVRIKYLLKFFPPLACRFEVFSFFLDFIFVLLGFFLISVFNNAQWIGAGNLK